MSSAEPSATNKELSPGKALRMQRLLDANNHFSIVALDQRAILSRMLAECLGSSVEAVPFSDLLAVKRLLVETLGSKASAMLFDPNIAVPAALDALPTHTGLVVSLEHHVVEDTPGGRKSVSIPGWSVAKISRLGADAVKLLIWYHPDASADVLLHQQNYAREVGETCHQQEIPFVLELLAYQPPCTDEHAQQHGAFNSAQQLPDVVCRSVREFVKSEYNVDLLKLESPVPVDLLTPLAQATTAQALAAPDPAFTQIGRLCGEADIPWVLLSAGVTTAQFVTVLQHAYAAGAQGFLAGRAIWKEPLQSFPDLHACQARLREEGADALQQLLDCTAPHAHRYTVPRPEFTTITGEGDFALRY